MSEPVVTTQDYVRAAISGDAIKAKEIFNQLMAPKVVDAVAQRKAEVAQNYFDDQKPEIEPTAAELSDDSQEEPYEDEQVTDKEEEPHETA